MFIDDFLNLFREVHSNQDLLEIVLEQIGEQEEHNNPEVILEDDSR